MKTPLGGKYHLCKVPCNPPPLSENSNFCGGCGEPLNEKAEKMFWEMVMNRPFPADYPVSGTVSASISTISGASRTYVASGNIDPFLPVMVNGDGTVSQAKFEVTSGESENRCPVCFAKEGDCENAGWCEVRKRQSVICPDCGMSGFAHTPTCNQSVQVSQCRCGGIVQTMRNERDCITTSTCTSCGFLQTKTDTGVVLSSGFMSDKRLMREILNLDEPDEDDKLSIPCRKCSGLTKRERDIPNSSWKVTCPACGLYEVFGDNGMLIERREILDDDPDDDDEPECDTPIFVEN